MDRVFAMALVAMVWAFLACACGGLGLFLRRVVSRDEADVPDAFRCIWLGFAVLVSWLQVVHLEVPVTAWGVVPVLLVGVAGFGLLGRSAVRAWWPEFRSWRFLCLVCALLLLWVANRSIGATLNADIDFYHRATAMWFSGFPLLRGFANVQLWLGYNQNSFLYAAGLYALPLSIPAEHVANSFLWVAAFLQAAWSVGRVTRRQGGGAASDVLWACAAFPLVLFLFSGHLTGYSPEMYLFVAVFVVCAELVNLWTQTPGIAAGSEAGGSGTALQPAKGGADRAGALDGMEVRANPDIEYEGGEASADAPVGSTAARGASDVFPLLVLVSVSCVAMTMKVSSIPFFGMAILSGLWAYVRQAGLWRGWWRAGMVSAGCAVLILGVWMYRGILTSGYPLYPSAILYLDVPWLVAPETVSGLHEYLLWASREGFGIRDNQRMTGSLWCRDWMPTWFHYHVRSGWSWALGWIPFAGMVVFPLLSRGLREKAGGRSGAGASAFLGVLAVPLVAVVAWFLTAPRFLYLGSILWGGAFAALALSGLQDHRLGRRLLKHTPAVLLIVAGVLVGTYTVRHPVRSFPALYMATTESGFYAVPAPLRFEVIEVDGIDLHCPLPLYDAQWDLVLWRGPPPLLPAKGNSLSFRLRTHGRLEDGFLPDKPKSGLLPREAEGMY